MLFCTRILNNGFLLSAHIFFIDCVLKTFIRLYVQLLLLDVRMQVVGR